MEFFGNRGFSRVRANQRRFDREQYRKGGELGFGINGIAKTYIDLHRNSGSSQLGLKFDAHAVVPANLKAPAVEEVILVGHATGVQIYVCQAAANPPFAWVFKAPEADLSDSNGKTIIHHFAGPTWKYIDGSDVVGKLVAKQDAPKPGAIPWLLLTAASHTGQGVLTRVTSIQRIHTEGGAAPNATTSDALANGNESRSAYSADYYFYAPAH